MKSVKRALIATVAAALSLQAAPATQVPAYAVPVGDAYSVTPILSVGDQVPETGNPSNTFQMIGIPDGLGVQKTPTGSVVWMNHELTGTTLSEPIVGGALNRGAFVSKFTLDADGSVLSGERAHDSVFAENSLVGPAAEVGNSTPAFSRLCSASLAGTKEGFDRPIYFAGEESSGSGTFDGRGGQAIAFFDNEAHTIPKLGRFAYENIVPLPTTNGSTVLIGLEDGPSGLDSQLWMYVGTKDPSSPSVMRKNGLDNGKLYTFVSRTPGRFDESSFKEGLLVGIWVEVPGAEAMTDTELDIAAKSLGAFNFIRPEDGEFAQSSPGDLFFVTTGGSAALGNELGRVYQLKLNPIEPTLPAVLSILVNADLVVKAGGDTAISPDNIAVNGEYLMVQEDGTSPSRPVMSAKGRDGSIWRYKLLTIPGVLTTLDPNAVAERVVSLKSPGRDGVLVGAGIWETSGIVDSTSIFGDGSFVFDVQAHGPTAAPAPNTVEDGQLLIMRKR